MIVLPLSGPPPSSYPVAQSHRHTACRLTPPGTRLEPGRRHINPQRGGHAPEAVGRYLAGGGGGGGGGLPMSVDDALSEYFVTTMSADDATAAVAAATS